MWRIKREHIPRGNVRIVWDPLSWATYYAQYGHIHILYENYVLLMKTTVQKHFIVSLEMWHMSKYITPIRSDNSHGRVIQSSNLTWFSEFKVSLLFFQTILSMSTIVISLLTTHSYCINCWTHLIGFFIKDRSISLYHLLWCIFVQSYPLTNHIVTVLTNSWYFLHSIMHLRGVNKSWVDTLVWLHVLTVNMNPNPLRKGHMTSPYQILDYYILTPLSDFFHDNLYFVV